eukprot:4335218-Pleurochrysis_carterae.AAC.2
MIPTLSHKHLPDVRSSTQEGATPIRHRIRLVSYCRQREEMTIPVEAAAEDAILRSTSRQLSARLYAILMSIAMSDMM